MSTERLDIELHLGSTFWNQPPQCKVWLDEVVIRQLSPVLGDEIVKWSGDVEDGTHSIRVGLFNKDPVRETLIEDGKVSKDQLLNIDSLLLDEIEVGVLRHSNGVLTTTDGRTFKEIVNIGYNGIWEFQFETPLYLWLLENL